LHIKFPTQATVKKWALRSSGILLALALISFIAFGVISYHEEAESVLIDEPDDSF
jgi:hypothetical protein